MLKNMNEFLNKELSSAKNEIMKERILLNQRKLNYLEIKNKVTEWVMLNKSIEDHNESLKGIILITILWPILALCLLALSPHLVPFYLSAVAIIEGICIYHYHKESKEVKEYKRKIYHDLKLNPTDYKYVGDTERIKLDFKLDELGRQVEESKKALEDYFMYINTLNEYINDDAITKLNDQFKEDGKLPEVIKYALEEEYKAYLNEPIDPVAIDLEVKHLTEDDCLKATKKLHIDLNPKEESRKEVGPMNLKKTYKDIV